MSPLLEVRDLHVRYGPIHAARGLGLEVSDGEVVALLGPNGAGKSSTLRAISALEPYQGSVVFDGVDLGRRSPSARSRAGLVHVPEGRRIFPTLSVHENLQVARAARGRRPPSFTIDDVYGLFPLLADLRARSGWALSGGEQQMLAVGRGLLGAPRLLLLDEPSLGLAPTLVDVLFEALEELSSRVPMLLVEQNTQLALDVAHRGLVLNHGEVVLEGPAVELRDRRQLIDSYLGQTDASEAGDGPSTST